MNTVDMQGLAIPRVALGTWSWGFGGVAGGDTIFGNTYGAEELKPVFERAMELGLTLWDTATVYASGGSEKILGQFIADNPNAIVSTKFTPFMAMRKGIKTIDEYFKLNMANIGRDVIDIYWIHNTDDIERWTPQLVPLLESGRVKRVGVSNHNLEQIKRVQEILKALGHQVHAIQNHYSMLYKNIETTGILEYCKEEDITVFTYMVLEQGALSGKYTKENPLPVGTRRGEAFPPSTLGKLQPLFDYMSTLGEKYNASVAQIATAWAINKGTVPIIGVTKLNQVDDAAKSASIVFTSEELASLDHISDETGVTVKGDWEESM